MPVGAMVAGSGTSPLLGAVLLSLTTMLSMPKASSGAPCVLGNCQERVSELAE